jgi:hypothetical protein
MLILSLDCLSSSCILFPQCWQCLAMVCLHPVQWRDNFNIGHTRYRMKTNNRETMSTLGTQVTGWKQTIDRQCQDCLSSSCILFPQCWQCLSNVCFHPVSCFPNVDIVSRLFVFILYLVCPMLILSLAVLPLIRHTSCYSYSQDMLNTTEWWTSNW